MSKESFLTLLYQNQNRYLSGEAASAALGGLSRAAVWKYVDALRGDGYVIEARTGLGYRMVQAPDVLTEAEIRRFLKPVACVGRSLCCLEEVDSTNTYCKQAALSGAQEGTVVIADCQRAGRGRMDRTFQSPAGKGVYLSALLRPRVPTEALMSVTALTAVAVSNAIEQVCGVRPGIKWTNDLILGGKKLCGILTELSLEGESGRIQYLVIGIGVNVLQGPEDFSPDVAQMATSLRQELGRPVSRAELAAAEIRELDRLYAALCSGETAPYREAYRRACVTLGREVQLLRADGSREQVQALDIDDQFGLVVRRNDGTRTVIRSGEVSVRGMYGYAE